MRWVGGWRWAFLRTHTPGLATHKQEGNPNFRGPPQRVRGLSPMLGTHLGALLCEDEPGPWALKPVGLTLGEPEGYRKQTPCQGLTCQQAHSFWPWDTEGCKQPTQRALQEQLALVARLEHVGHKGHLLHTPTSPRSGEVRYLPKHKNKHSHLGNMKTKRNMF